MSTDRQLRVTLVLDTAHAASWHGLVVDALRATPVDLHVDTGRVRADADVVVDLTGRAWADEPRFGLWRYGFGDGAPSADGARGTLARLYAVRGVDRAMVLREGWFRAPSADGPGITDVGACVAPWCALVVRALAAGGPMSLEGPVVRTGECDAAVPPADTRGVVDTASEAAARWWRRERWTIGIVDASCGDIVGGADIPEPRWLQGVRGDQFFADPFPLQVEAGCIRLLAEEHQQRTGRGRIVALTVRADGGIADASAVLDLPHHLSYPFVLDADGEVYVVPEASSTGAATAYLLNDTSESIPVAGIAAIDPTFVRHAGRWWMFCTLPGPLNQTNLYVFHAVDWRGPWEPHLLNPVKSDARSSRPGGAFFAHDGALYRPAQDCSRRYGGALAINRIVELTPMRFCEEVVRVVRPLATWAYPHGLHTLNAAGPYVVVDGLRVGKRGLGAGGWGLGAGERSYTETNCVSTSCR